MSMAPKEKKYRNRQTSGAQPPGVHGAVAGLTESQAAMRPDPARWSVLDCVEHVTTVEERFLGWLEAAEKLDAPRVDKEKEAGLMARIPDRSVRVQAPEAVLPAGRLQRWRKRSISSTPDARAAFSSRRIVATSFITWPRRIRAWAP